MYTRWTVRVSVEIDLPQSGDLHEVYQFSFVKVEFLPWRDIRKVV